MKNLIQYILAFHLFGRLTFTCFASPPPSTIDSDIDDDDTTSLHSLSPDLLTHILSKTDGLTLRDEIQFLSSTKSLYEGVLDGNRKRSSVISQAVQTIRSRCQESSMWATDYLPRKLFIGSIGSSSSGSNIINNNNNNNNGKDDDKSEIIVDIRRWTDIQCYAAIFDNLELFTHIEKLTIANIIPYGVNSSQVLVEELMNGLGKAMALRSHVSHIKTVVIQQPSYLPVGLAKFSEIWIQLFDKWREAEFQLDYFSVRVSKEFAGAGVWKAMMGFLATQRNLKILNLHFPVCPKIDEEGYAMFRGVLMHSTQELELAMYPTMRTGLQVEMKGCLEFIKRGAVEATVPIATLKSLFTSFDDSNTKRTEMDNTSAIALRSISISYANDFLGKTPQDTFKLFCAPGLESIEIVTDMVVKSMARDMKKCLEFRDGVYSNSSSRNLKAVKVSARTRGELRQLADPDIEESFGFPVLKELEQSIHEIIDTLSNTNVHLETLELSLTGRMETAILFADSVLPKFARTLKDLSIYFIHPISDFMLTDDGMSPRSFGYAYEDVERVFIRILDGFKEVPNIERLSLSGPPFSESTLRQWYRYGVDSTNATALLKEIRIDMPFFQYPQLTFGYLDSRDTKEGRRMSGLGEQLIRVFLRSLGQGFEEVKRIWIQGGIVDSHLLGLSGGSGGSISTSEEKTRALLYRYWRRRNWESFNEWTSVDDVV